MGYIGAGISRFNTADELTVTGDAEFNANANFGDSDKIQLGASQDLQIYHDGSNSFIKDAGPGSLQLHVSGLDVLNAAAGEFIIRAAEDGSVDLYHDNSKKLETTSTGIDVTGTVTADGLTVNTGTTDIATRFESTDGTAGIALSDNAGSVGIFTRDTGDFSINVGGDASSSASNASEALRILSDGKVGIGKSSSITDKLHIENTGANCLLSVARTDGAAGRLVMQHTSSVGALQTTGSVPLTFGTADTERLRILAGGGLTFNGDTAAANALDDYEEGTFTPTLDSAFYAGTLTINGYYTKVGNKVFVAVGAKATTSISMTGSGSSYISGMPFAMDNSQTNQFYSASWSNAHTGGTFGNGLAAYGNLYSGQTISMGANAPLAVTAIYLTTA